MSQDQFESLFNKAKELMQRTLDPVHDWFHIERVLANAEKIFNLLSEEKRKTIDRKILKLAIAWHDISFIKHKASPWQYLFEGWRAKKIAKKYFKQFGLAKKEIRLLADIILRHNWIEKFIYIRMFLSKKRSICYQIVQDADTLDYFHQDRIEQAKMMVKNSLFRRNLMNLLKPIFINYFYKHKRYFLNLKESLEV